MDALEQGLLDLFKIDAKTKSEWKAKGLSGGYDTAADQIQSSLTALRAAKEVAGKSVDRAKAEIAKPSAGSHMAAKKEASEGHNALQKAVESARITSSVGGKTIKALPNYYSPEHVNTKAHELLAEHDREMNKAEDMRRSLSNATYGEKDKVGAALGDFESKHPRDENGKFT